MAKFILVRHGESVWNSQRRIQGNQDPELSKRGRQQTELLIAHLKAHITKAVAAIYTSPLRRATETADRIARAFGLPVIPDSGLREMSLGKWEGMGLDVRYLFRLKQDNTAISQVELDGRVRRVLLLNDTCHLAGGTLAARDVLTDAVEIADPSF